MDNIAKPEMTCPKKILTLVYLLQNKRILLGLKKRGFGEGKVSVDTFYSSRERFSFPSNPNLVNKCRTSYDPFALL